MSHYLEVERQRAKDVQYVQEAEAWLDRLTPQEIVEMKARGLVREKKGRNGMVTLVLADTGEEPADDVGRDDDAAVAAENRRDMSVESDMARAVDRLPDELMEDFGVTSTQASGLAKLIETRVRAATIETQSLLLARIVGFFLAGNENLQVRAHGLAHAVPRLASLNGFASLRASAAACGVSVEWISRMRERWCRQLGLEVPEESTKSPAAKKAYSEDKKTNHWRTQKCKAQPSQNGTKPAPPSAK